MRAGTRSALLTACAAHVIACGTRQPDRGPEKPEAWLPDVQPDEIPDRPMVARAGGRLLGEVHVILEEEGPDRVRIEIADASPAEACGTARGSLGISVRIGSTI